MHKHSELNRRSNKSALLCANAPEISARCISQPSVFFAKLVPPHLQEQMKTAEPSALVTHGSPV